MTAPYLHSFRGPASPKKRIAFVTKNWLGDILMLTPAIRMLRVNFPDAEIIGFLPERCRDVLSYHPDVDRLISFHEREETRGLIRQYQFIKQVRQEHIDQVYLFHRSFSRALLFRLAGATERIGYATKSRGGLLTDACEEPREPMHQSSYALNLLIASGLSLPAEDLVTRFYPSEEHRALAEKLLECFEVKTDHYVVIHAGANWAPKRWPTEYWALLADYLSDVYGVDVLLTGASHEADLAYAISARTRTARPMVLTGKTTLGVLGALFERARLVVSGDSGPMHLAAGVGAPLFALFLATDAGLTGPRGSGPIAVVQKLDAVRHVLPISQSGGKIWRVTETDPETVIGVLENSGLLEHRLAARV